MQKCRFCSGSETVKRGWRKNRIEKKQIFLCKSCNKKFTHDDGYIKMRYPEKTIKMAVSIYRNHSSSETREILRSKGVIVSRWTIIKWARKYS